MCLFIYIFTNGILITNAKIVKKSWQTNVFQVKKTDQTNIVWVKKSRQTKKNQKNLHPTTSFVAL